MNSARACYEAYVKDFFTEANTHEADAEKANQTVFLFSSTQ